MTIHSNYSNIATDDVQNAQFRRIPYEYENPDHTDNNSDQNTLEAKKHNLADSLLTPQELATLHMFFGVEKPAELSFYGNAKIQQIHKGYLVDIIS